MTANGVASTAPSLIEPPSLIREGALPREALEAILGRPIAPVGTGRMGSPG